MSRTDVLDRRSFDVDAGGIPRFGVEDACSLLGFPRMKIRTFDGESSRATSVYIPTPHAARA